MRLNTLEQFILFFCITVFEINEEKDVLNMMGMTLGLDKPGQCTQANLAKARSLVPRALEPYVVDIYNGVGRGDEANGANGGVVASNAGKLQGLLIGSTRNWTFL